MRFAEYHSRQLHEYGLLNEHALLCSTGRGIFSSPVKQPKPDIHSELNPIEFTQFTPVDHLPDNTKAMRLKYGNFQALIRPDNILRLRPAWMNVSIFILTNKQVLKIAGETQTELISQQSTANTSRLDGLTWHYQSCYAQNSCALYEINILGFIADNKAIIITELSILTLLLALSAISICRALKRYFSFNRQVFIGLNEGQILCYYQPIINNQDRSQSYCEVLCRWQDKEGVIHGAFPFLAQVTRNQQTDLFTKVLVTKAIKEFKKAGLFGKIKLSINSFPQDLAQNNIEQILEQELSFEDHKSIVVEITEQQAGNHQAINKAIERLHAKGVRIAIDDFGTGHSNLEQLANLNLDYLKIDQSFVFGILDNKLHMNLIEHILKLAGELELTIVAEGVETQALQSKIESLDIKFSQGYYHAKPMPIKDLVKFFDL